VVACFDGLYCDLANRKLNDKIPVLNSSVVAQITQWLGNLILLWIAGLFVRMQFCQFSVSLKLVNIINYGKLDRARHCLRGVGWFLGYLVCRLGVIASRVGILKVLWRCFAAGWQFVVYSIFFTGLMCCCYHQNTRRAFSVRRCCGGATLIGKLVAPFSINPWRGDLGNVFLVVRAFAVSGWLGKSAFR